MSNTARQTALNAEHAHFNPVGMCLAVCRTWAGIPAKYPDATSSALHAPRRLVGTPPRGAAVYWLGGSHGHGHIAISLGNGMIRSTDAGGAGRVATVPTSWIHTHWGLRYAGWSWEINDVVIKHK